MIAIRRVALVANHEWTLEYSSVKFDVYADGLAALGIESRIVCLEGCEVGYPHPTVRVPNLGRLHDPRFWEQIGCDVAVLFSWHGQTELMTAIRRVGVRVLALGDTDGQVSPRYHPLACYRVVFSDVQVSAIKRLRWVLGAVRAVINGRSRQLHLAIARNLQAPDVYTLPNVGAIRVFDDFLARAGFRQLTGRVRWLPYPVPEYVVRRPVEIRRQNQMICVGRWSMRQKNAPLLAETIQRVFAVGQTTRFVIVGADGNQAFGDLAANFPDRVQVLGRQPREKVCEIMADSRAIVFASRFEGSPVSANEMLASGGTVVGTPLPSLVGLMADGRFGRVSQRHTARALSDSILRESEAWDLGQRHPEEIAAYWRPLVSPEGVARRLVDMLNDSARQIVDPDHPHTA